MNRTFLPFVAVGLSTALFAQSQERTTPAEQQLWQVEIRGISG